MPSKQQLPQPNLPDQAGDSSQSGQKSGQNSGQPASDSQPASGAGAQTTSQPQALQNSQSQSREGGQGRGQSQATQTTAAQTKAAQVPAGLDPSSPGGSPPPVDEQGRVQGKAANISTKREKKEYNQQANMPPGPSGLDQKLSQVGAQQAQGSGQRGGSGQPGASGAQPGQAGAGPGGAGLPASLGQQGQGGGQNQGPVMANQAVSGVKSGQAPVSGAQMRKAGVGPGGGAGSMPAGLAGAAGLPGAPPGQGSGQAPNQAFNQAQGQALNQAPPAQAPPVGEPNFPGEPDFPQNSGQQPIFAQIKNNPLKFLPFALGGVAIIAILIVVGSKLLGGGQPDVGGTEPGGETNTAANSGDNSPSVGGNTSSTGTADTNTTGAGAGDNVILTYWGLWEPSSVLQDVLKDFEQQHPGVSVDYHKQSHKDYYSRLQTAIASGNGPDVFRYHATWVPMLSEELAAMPNSVMTASKYKQTFYPIVSEQLQFNGQVVGIPLMYDGLALFYNKDILQAANSEVPKTWGELKLLADQLTVRSEGQVERGGLAIGNTSNVQHWSDILGLLIYQNGGDPAQPVSSEVRDAIKFYVSFGQDEPVYTTSLPGATTAFIREEVAMMFGPSWRALQIKNAKPDLQFGIAPVPKLSEQELAWASYWAEGVSSKSKNQEEAWALLQYLSSKATLQKLYSAQSKTRAFGAIYPRRDLADEISDSLVAAYLLDAANARSWYLCSFTHDDGINDKIIDYYQDAVNKMAEGESEEEVLQTLSQGVKQVLRQYDAGE